MELVEVYYLMHGLEVPQYPIQPAIQGGCAHPVPGGAGPVHYTERHRVHRDQPDVQCI